MRLLVSNVLVALLASLVGFNIGARLGADQVMMASSAGDAIVATSYLGMIDRGELDSLKGFIDMDLNISISSYGGFLDKDYGSIFLLSPYFDSSEARDGYMRGAVKYRLENPYSIDWNKGVNAESRTKHEIENIAEIERFYQSMLQLYAQDAHNK